MDDFGDLILLHTSWEDVERLSEELAQMIIDSGYEPDVVVAISRGGFDPARILCDQLGIRRLASVQVEFYSGVQDTAEKPRIVYPLNADVRGKSVLLVDDVSDTGVSLEAAKAHVLEGGPGDLRVATLHIKPWISFRPDYHASETEAWIVYPWEPVESVRSIAAKLDKNGYSDREIREKLLELGFNAKTLKRL
jgi:hypoxanthine phosphoribosyltransferase|tara:strand:- start:734 stop:1312 length:579 start_codon:yes stop_codon:yes gene_type:complete